MVAHLVILVDIKNDSCSLVDIRRELELLSRANLIYQLAAEVKTKSKPFGFTVPEISLLLIKFLEAQLKVELVLVLFRYAYARVFHMEPDDVVRNLVDLHSNLAFDSILNGVLQ